jgi:hypothetical protein
MTPKITTYTLVYFIDEEDLIKEVQQLIDEGWQPYGNLVSNPGCNIIQPMVRYE